ncbi:MAG: hypothetical protein HY328_05995 [Chloroflexi bacterium]|nr:hypothetical protein [Chloroflexota bacterium]
MNGPISREVDEILSRCAPGLHFLARSRMVLPALLFLSAHRPLAFIIGQSLWLCTPLELLLPEAGLGDWAEFLSHPQSGLALERLLENSLVVGSSAAEGLLE